VSGRSLQQPAEGPLLQIGALWCALQRETRSFTFLNASFVDARLAACVSRWTTRSDRLRTKTAKIVGALRHEMAHGVLRATERSEQRKPAQASDETVIASESSALEN
jgi:hypothetical protein